MNGPTPPTFGEFLIRWQLLALITALFAGVVVGSLSGSAGYRPGKMVTRSGLQTFEILPPEADAVGYFRNLGTWQEVVFQQAGPCWGERFQSEYQERQCTQFWSRNVKAGAVFLLPVLLAILHLLFGWWGMKAFYRRLQSAEKKFLFPSERPKDVLRLHFPSGGVRREWVGLASYLFRLKSAWLYGPKPAGEGKGVQRYLVYFAHDRELPQPGQSVLLAPIGRGAFYGILDTPQMSVLSAK